MDGGNGHVAAPVQQFPGVQHFTGGSCLQSVLEWHARPFGVVLVSVHARTVLDAPLAPPVWLPPLLVLPVAVLSPTLVAPPVAPASGMLDPPATALAPPLPEMDALWPAHPNTVNATQSRGHLIR